MGNTMSQQMDRLTNNLAQRLVTGAPHGQVRLFAIGDEGAEERVIESALGAADSDAATGPVMTLRWEDIGDAIAVEDGALSLEGAAYSARLAITGTASEINHLAALVKPGHTGKPGDFVPFVTRSAVMTDKQVADVLSTQGIAALFHATVQAQAEAFQFVNLVKEIGSFRGRWMVAGEALDLVGDDDGCRVEVASISEAPQTTIQWEPTALLRWLGTSCAPGAAGELTLLDALVNGKATLSGDSTLLEAASRLMPHSR